MADNNESKAASRRTVLKGTAGTAGAVTVPSSVAARADESSLDQRRARLQAKQAVLENYDENEIDQVFLEHAADELEALRERGVIESATLKEFSAVENKQSVTKISANGKVALRESRSEVVGGYTAQLSASVETETKVVTVVVVPELDFAESLVVSDNEANTQEILPSECDGYCSSSWPLLTCVCDPTNPISPIYCIREDQEQSGNCFDCGPPCSDCGNQEKCESSSGGWL